MKKLSGQIREGELPSHPVQFTDSAYCRKRIRKHFDSAKLCTDLKTFQINEYEGNDNLDSLLLIWQNFFISILNKHAPSTKLRVKSKSLLGWLTDDIRQAGHH